MAAKDSTKTTPASDPAPVKTKTVKLSAVKSRMWLLTFSNGCTAKVTAKNLPVYKFQMEKPGHAKCRVIDIQELEEAEVS